MPPTAAEATGERDDCGGRNGESHAKLSAPFGGVKGASLGESEMDVAKGPAFDVRHDERHLTLCIGYGVEE